MIKSYALVLLCALTSSCRGDSTMDGGASDAGASDAAMTDGARDVGASDGAGGDVGGSDAGGRDTGDRDADPGEEGLRAFPGAYGAGANSTGGRGGAVLHVTNLSDGSSPGSLRWALQQQYPRIIVFDVSGTINISGTLQLDLDNKDVTIAGQTAPEGGITITGGRIWFEYSDYVIIRYIKFRNGHTSNNGDCLSVNRTSNVVVDHCSFYYAKDEAVDLEDGNNTGSGNVTMSNCLVAESHTGTIGGDSSVYVGTDGDYTWIRNAFVNVSHRFPKYGGEGDVAVVNNVVHNWMARLSRFDPADFTLNEVNNYYQSGSNSSSNLNKIWSFPDGMSPEIHTSGNFVSADRRPSGYDADNAEGWAKFDVSPIDPRPEWFVGAAHPYRGVAPVVLTATQARDHAIANAGARHYLNADGTVGEYVDSLDTTYLGYLASASSVPSLPESSYGTQASDVPSHTRPSNYDSDEDGMPDVWEVAQGFDPDDASDGNGDADGDGYTNVEEFLNGVDR